MTFMQNNYFTNKVNAHLKEQYPFIPGWYHREYTNDFPISDEQNKKIIHLALSLSFMTMDHSFRHPTSIGLAAVSSLSNVYTLVNGWKENENLTNFCQVLQTAFAVIHLAGTIFARDLTMAANIVKDLLIEVANLKQHIGNGDRSEILKSCLKILINTLYLYGGAEAHVASLGLQTLLELCHAAEVFTKGMIPEIGLIHILATIIRGYQTTLSGNILHLKLQRDIVEFKTAPGPENDAKVKRLTTAINQFNAELRQLVYGK